MFNRNALKHAMIDADCSNRELAEACEISPSALYRRLNGSVPFTLGEIDHCVLRLGLTPTRRDQIFFAPEVT